MTSSTQPTTERMAAPMRSASSCAIMMHDIGQLCIATILTALKVDGQPTTDMVPSKSAPRLRSSDAGHHLPAGLLRRCACDGGLRKHAVNRAHEALYAAALGVSVHPAAQAI